jgi:uncharacterized protein (DUF697 family)/GTP-binding protein EngB required for normal cell division
MSENSQQNNAFDKEAPALGDKFAEEFNKYRASQPKPSILVVGGTGTGKSTLINLVFKRELAPTGAGKPVTVGIAEYANDDVSVILHDSAGYETGDENQKNFNAMIEKFIDEKGATPDTAIDLIWYCVSAPSARFTELDARIINELRGDKYKKPVAVIITQVDSVSLEKSEELRQTIQNECGDTIVFESTTDTEIELEHGLDALHDWSITHLDKSRRDSFLSASRRGLEQKLERGKEIIMQHITGAAITGMSPIPFSDAPILIANQIGLLVRLASLWDMPQIKTLATGGITTTIVANLGKTLAGNLLKLIPGLGSWAGAAINAGVAAAITYGLGSATNEVCYKATKAELNGESFPLSDFFNADFLKIVSDLIKGYNPQKK